MIKTSIGGNIGNPVYRAVFSFIANVLADTPENGALSSIYCATAAIAVEHRGCTFSPGPRVALYKWTTKAFSEANCALAFDAIDKAIVFKGFKGFE